MSKGHIWKFFRAGGFDQVRIDNGADMAALEQLDQKLWVALSCPTRGVEFDTRTLELIDTDKDGHVHVPEILAATRWACRCLKNADDLVKGLPSLPLAAINDADPEGQRLLTSARHILARLGREGAAEISPADAMDTEKIFAESLFNGDGVVPAEAADNADLQAIITDTISCLGPEPDRGGKPGITQAKVDTFLAEAQAFSDWWGKAEGKADVLPLGDATAAAAAVVRKIGPKLDDFFARCRLAAFDARAIDALNREEKEYLSVAAQDMTISAAEVAGFPLARIEANRPLPLTEGLNPAWAEDVTALGNQVILPLLGERTALTEAEWLVLAGKFAAYEGWMAEKAGAAVEKLGIQRVRDILSRKPGEALAELIAKDKALEGEVNAITDVERLARYYRDLYRLLLNFVNFRDFYSRKEQAIFQAGTLYLDQRSCELCLTVEDAGRHASMAALAGAYLAYCDCVRQSTGEKIQIVAAFTDGDSDNLMVGRNGLFYDRKGQDWAATIVKIVDNPISLRQAFWSPYKKFVRMIEEQVAKRASAAEAASTGKMQATATTVAAADKTPKAAEPKKLDVGTVAALGVGVGAIATVIGGLVAGFLGLTWWQMLLALAALFLLISAPSMVIAALKLRKRNLGPILDANGWAINAKAKINIPFGRSLTGTPKLPPGSQRSTADPFAPKRTGRTMAVIMILAALVLLALWYLGRI